MGGDWGYDQGSGEVVPSGGAKDHGDDGKALGRRRVGVSIGSGGGVSRVAPPHQGVHKYTK